MTTLLSCVIDASVLIKLFLREENSADVQFIIGRYLEDDSSSLLAVPDLTYIECANILWQKSRKGAYTFPVAREALAQLRLLALPTTPTMELMERALEIFHAHDVSAYDACYVALAEKLHAPLLTADAKLAERMTASPHRVMLVREYLAEMALLP